MKTLTTLLLALLVSGSLWAQSPEEALYKYFELFNRADKEAINKASDSPFVFLIGNNKTVSEYYGDSVDFEGLRNQGWAYSKINEMCTMRIKICPYTVTSIIRITNHAINSTNRL